MTHEELETFKSACERIIVGVERDTIDDFAIAGCLHMLGGDPNTIRRLTNPTGNQASLLLYFTALLGRQLAKG